MTSLSRAQANAGQSHVTSQQRTLLLDDRNASSDVGNHYDSEITRLVIERLSSAN
jgi:hypothetical protein